MFVFHDIYTFVKKKRDDNKVYILSFTLASLSLSPNGYTLSSYKLLH